MGGLHVWTMNKLLVPLGHCPVQEAGKNKNTKHIVSSPKSIDPVRENQHHPKDRSKPRAFRILSPPKDTTCGILGWCSFSTRCWIYLDPDMTPGSKSFENRTFGRRFSLSNRGNGWPAPKSPKEEGVHCSVGSLQQTEGV